MNGPAQMLPDVSCPRSKPWLLLVEDEPSLRQLLTEMPGADYTLRVAPDGERAWELALQGEGPDLVLADVEMPGLSGIELTRRLRALDDTSTVPILLFSANNRLLTLLEGLDVGADDFIPKPFRPQELLARLRSRHQLCEMRREVTTRRCLERWRQRPFVRVDAPPAGADTAFFSNVSHEFRTPPDPHARAAGLELLRELRGDARTRKIPVILLSARARGRRSKGCKRVRTIISSSPSPPVNCWRGSPRTRNWAGPGGRTRCTNGRASNGLSVRARPGYRGRKKLSRLPSRARRWKPRSGRAGSPVKRTASPLEGQPPGHHEPDANAGASGA